MKKLDEMKRLKLLKIEEKGFYLMFYGLVCVIVVQAFLNDFKDIQEVILPMVLLVIVSVYFIIVVSGCKSKEKYCDIYLCRNCWSFYIWV